MRAEWRHALSTELSGHAAKRLVAQISQWHRIQASPMYREAAEWVHATLSDWGLIAEIEYFPTAQGRRVWGEPLFDEWTCRSATLDLLDTSGASIQRLADYHAIPLSLLPRSCAANGEFELVALRGGSRRDDYVNQNIRGKLVLIEASPMAAYPHAIAEFGAAGVLFDGMRTIPHLCPPGDLPDAIQYASWWWYGNEPQAFGFALSPRVGAELRERLARNEPLRLRVAIDAEFSPGHIEAVSALIPGKSSAEVLLMAHLCHPAPCANDNASGAAAVMEVARAINAMITSGQIARPQRSLRFLWVPEMTGTYLYLANHPDRTARTIAGLNLDMVGADQALCGSINTIIEAPEALPAFAATLLERLRADLHPPRYSFAGRNDPPHIREAIGPISNGSDHYIFADPSVGVPMPLIIEWPDRFYHTTADTIDHISPETLMRNMEVAASYLLEVANADRAAAERLAEAMNGRFLQHLAEELRSAADAARAGEPPLGPNWAARVQHRIARHQAALASLQRLAPDFNGERFVRQARHAADALWAMHRETLATWHQSERPSLPPEIAQRVPKRLVPGPVSLSSLIAAAPTAERPAFAARMAAALSGLPADLALYWADGARDLATISALVEQECDLYAPFGISALFELLADLAIIEWG